MFKSIKSVALFFGAILLVISLACNLPVGSSDVPETRIPVSENAAENLEQNLAKAVEDIQNGDPTILTINEAEITSLVVYRLEQQSGGSISDSQVYLRNGAIQYRGTLKQAPVSVPVEAEILVSAGSDGRLDYEVVDVSAGPFNLMQEMVDNLTSQLDQALYASDSQLNNIIVENVTIADGVMTISGRPR